jgi:hypothetical protein
MSVERGEVVYGPRPTVQALLLCDYVIAEEGTRKKTLVGVFDIVNLPRNVPRAQAQLTGARVYARLLDAVGRYIFRIDCVQVEGERVIARAVTPPIEIDDRLAPLDVTIGAPVVSFSEPGRYEFRLYANDAYVGHAPLRVVPGGEPGG